MSSRISTLTKKFLGRKSGGSADDSDSGPAMNIGTPTNVKRLIHAEADGNSIRGLPPEYEKMLMAMMTAEERANPVNTRAAENALLWQTREQQKKEAAGGHSYMYGDFFPPGSSGESSASARSSSGDDEAKVVEVKQAAPQVPATLAEASENADVKESESSVEPAETSPTGSGNANEGSPDLDNRPAVIDEQNNASSSTTPAKPPRPQPRSAGLASPADADAGEATLRRKDTQTGRGGPRVTRNITEEQVYQQLNALCSEGHPLDKYDRDIELGSGAAGTVFLAVDRESGEKVAIKVIDLQKQPKKEMILMELKVRRWLVRHR